MKFYCPKCGGQFKWEFATCHSEKITLRLIMKCECGVEIALPIVEGYPIIGIMTVPKIDPTIN